MPGIIAEAGGSGLLTEPETQMMVDGVTNVLRSLGMLEGEAQPHSIGRYRPLELAAVAGGGDVVPGGCRRRGGP